MYGREYDGRELTFEASGGLYHWALVMQDRETDSFWSIMTGESLAGPLQGRPLDELALGQKMRWGDWKAKHPHTWVLSVDGVEHEDTNRYANYFQSDTGPRGVEATDVRLPTKTPIYAFHADGKSWAVPSAAVEGGASFDTGPREVFLHRTPGTAIFASTVAYTGRPGTFRKRGAAWVHLPSGRRFDARTGTFVGEGPEPARLDGFDTFWFSWSLANPDTQVLGR